MGGQAASSCREEEVEGASKDSRPRDGLGGGKCETAPHQRPYNLLHRHGVSDDSYPRVRPGMKRNCASGLRGTGPAGMIDVTFRSSRSSSSVHAPGGRPIGKRPEWSSVPGKCTAIGRLDSTFIRSICMESNIFISCVPSTISHLPADVLKACIEPWIVESPRKRLPEGTKSAKPLLNRDACTFQSSCMR